MNPPELLYECPRCHHTGYTLRGRKAPYCRVAAPKQQLTLADGFAPERECRRLSLDEIAGATATPLHPQPR